MSQYSVHEVLERVDLCRIQQRHCGDLHIEIAEMVFTLPEASSSCPLALLRLHFPVLFLILPSVPVSSGLLKFAIDL